jgi:GNAT superfamily N-acetyltransferase
MTGGALEIRTAGPADVGVILQMIRALAEYERMSDEVVTSELQLQASLFGDRPAAEVVLAFESGTPVGFAVFFHNFSTFLGRAGLYLEDLFVIPDARGRGIGRRLFAYVANVACERDCGRMEWAVLDWNEPALGFYTKMGARPMDQWTVHRLTGRALEEAAQSAD